MQEYIPANFVTFKDQAFDDEENIVALKQMESPWEKYKKFDFSH